MLGDGAAQARALPDGLGPIVVAGGTEAALTPSVLDGRGLATRAVTGAAKSRYSTKPTPSRNARPVTARSRERVIADPPRRWSVSFRTRSLLDATV